MKKTEPEENDELRPEYHFAESASQKAGRGAKKLWRQRLFRTGRGGGLSRRRQSRRKRKR